MKIAISVLLLALYITQTNSMEEIRTQLAHSTLNLSNKEDREKTCKTVAQFGTESDLLIFCKYAKKINPTHTHKIQVTDATIIDFNENTPLPANEIHSAARTEQLNLKTHYLPYLFQYAIEANRDQTLETIINMDLFKLNEPFLPNKKLPLHYAAQCDSDKAVWTLTYHGANIDTCDNSNLEALDIAELYNANAAKKMLIYKKGLCKECLIVSGIICCATTVIIGGLTIMAVLSNHH